MPRDSTIVLVKAAIGLTQRAASIAGGSSRPISPIVSSNVPPSACWVQRSDPTWILHLLAFWLRDAFSLVSVGAYNIAIVFHSLVLHNGFKAVLQCIRCSKAGLCDMANQCTLATCPVFSGSHVGTFKVLHQAGWFQN